MHRSLSRQGSLTINETTLQKGTINNNVIKEKCVMLRVFSPLLQHVSQLKNVDKIPSKHSSLLKYTKTQWPKAFRSRFKESYLQQTQTFTPSLTFRLGGAQTYFTVIVFWCSCKHFCSPSSEHLLHSPNLATNDELSAPINVSHITTISAQLLPNCICNWSDYRLLLFHLFFFLNELNCITFSSLHF